MPLGTSMDYESADSRSKNCWDPAANLTVFYEKWTSPSATPDFVVDDVWCGLVGGIGFGAAATAERSAFWTQTLKDVYKGDEGRKKVRMALNCLLERDGLLLRIGDIKCPVHWLQVSLTVSFYGNGGDRRIDKSIRVPKMFRSRRSCLRSILNVSLRLWMLNLS
jgi:microsomal epoxide hydrolase